MMSFRLTYKSEIPTYSGGIAHEVTTMSLTDQEAAEQFISVLKADKKAKHTDFTIEEETN